MIYTKFSLYLEFFLRSSGPFDMYLSGLPSLMGEAKGEHHIKINKVRLLMTFAMWRAIAFVGATSVLRKFVRSSKSRGTRG